MQHEFDFATSGQHSSRLYPSRRDDTPHRPSPDCDFGVDGDAAHAIADGGHVIAAIVLLPSTISPAEAMLLERAMLLRFEYGDELDRWLHASNRRLGDTSPFERLVRGDVFAVLRALITVPLLDDVSNSERGHDGWDLARLKLVG